jgi:DNA repair protein RadC
MNKKLELMKELMALEAAEAITKISTPQDIIPMLDIIVNEEQEHFVVVTLNGAHEVIKTHMISKGIVDRVLLHPREVFRPALIDNATCIVIAHNHPSGNTEPSSDDKFITVRLQDAGKLLGIEVLDHMIVSKRGWYSFSIEGEM